MPNGMGTCLLEVGLINDLVIKKERKESGIPVEVLRVLLSWSRLNFSLPSLVAPQTP